MARNATLTALLGASVDQITEAHINALIGQVREVAQLDFKQSLYADAKKIDLAGDVAAMANSLGGALLLGVEETDALATGLKPVALSETEERRMKQIVASNTAPHVPFDIWPVPTAADATKGFYILDIPRSSAAPHAVLEGRNLRYPKRDGATTRWLTESEVADHYRNRMAGAREQATRLEEVSADGAARMPVSDHAWLRVAAVPNLPGEMPITADAIRTLGGITSDMVGPDLVSSELRRHLTNFGVGPRRATGKIGASLEDGSPIGGYVELHQDGATFGGTWIGWPDRDGDGPGIAQVGDGILVQAAIDLLDLVATHAIVNCGCSGDVLVEVGAVCAGPMGIVRQVFPSPQRIVGYTTAVPAAHHTFSLEDLRTPAGLVVAARIIANDVLQGLGVAETNRIAPDGSLIVAAWADASGIVQLVAPALGIPTS